MPRGPYNRRTIEQRIQEHKEKIEELRKELRDRDTFSPKACQEDRQRLELSVPEYARLIGVSTLTIYSWEDGSFIPRTSHVRRWLEVRAMPKRKVWDKLGICNAPGRHSFSPEAVIAERERLELSAADYGELVGVSKLTIYNWEHGRSKPRRHLLAKWLKVKGIGKRKAWRRLGLV